MNLSLKDDIDEQDFKTINDFSSGQNQIKAKRGLSAVRRGGPALFAMI